jgi:hypothetical protein
LQEDVRGLPEDVRELPEDVRGLPEDVRGLPEDVRGLPEDVRGIARGCQVTFDQTFFKSLEETINIFLHIPLTNLRV